MKLSEKVTPIVLPPSPELCQVCGFNHSEELPHNPESIYYQITFNMEHGRLPTWDDAMLHCTDELKIKWAEMLKSVIAALKVVES